MGMKQRPRDKKTKRQKDKKEKGALWFSKSIEILHQGEYALRKLRQQRDAMNFSFLVRRLKRVCSHLARVTHKFPAKRELRLEFLIIHGALIFPNVNTNKVIERA